MREYKHVTAKAYKHLIMRAYKHVSIQKLHIPLTSQSPQQSSIIVKAFDCTNVQLQDHLSLQAYRHIIIQVCAYVCGYQTCEYRFM